jgi:hypothetical protein
MGMFDDLIPGGSGVEKQGQATQTPGMFDDLIQESASSPGDDWVSTKPRIEHKPRFGDALKDYFGGHNPIAETYDLIAPALDMSSDRDIATRAVDTAGFLANIPVRMATQGRYGIDDALQSATGGALNAERLAEGEQRFIENNPALVRALGTIGEAAAGASGALGQGFIRQGPLHRPRNVLRETQAAAAARDLEAMERSGIRPFGPAFSQGPMAATAKQTTEIPILGGPVRSALEESLTDARAATQAVAGRMGQTTTPERAGNIVEHGLERYRDARPDEVVARDVAGYTPAQQRAIIAAPARETSLKTKQAALYERAWSFIPEDMREGRSVVDRPRVMGNPTNTRDLLRDITNRNLRLLNQARVGRDGGDAIAYPVQGGMLGRIVRDLIESPTQTMSLQTLRDLRSELRRLSSGMADTEKNTLKLSDLDRLQVAVTEDIITVLERNATRYADDPATARNFERAIAAFRRADRFTRLSMERLEHIEKMFNAPSAEALYRSIAQAALIGGRGDLQRLAILRRTLRGDEMSEIAGAVIRNLGEPTGSARGVAQTLNFSVASFMTRWNNMTPEARNYLFAPEHRQAIDDLVHSIDRLANVEALANTSRTASNALGIGGLFAAGSSVASGSMLPILGSLATGTAASIIFSRPEYARWAVRYAQLRAGLRDGNGGASLRQHIARLTNMARTNPHLATVLQAVHDDNP